MAGRNWGRVLFNISEVRQPPWFRRPSATMSAKKNAALMGDSRYKKDSAPVVKRAS